MDAAIKTITKNVTDTMAAKFTAAKEIAPYVGDIDPLAFDSAESIYEYALKTGNIKLAKIHKSAYRAMLPLLPRNDRLAPPLAMDAAAQTELTKKYPHIPALG